MREVSFVYLFQRWIGCGGKYGAVKHRTGHGLDSPPIVAHNHNMVILGRIKNGVVVLDGGPPLAEGTIVSVSCDFPAVGKPAGAGRVKFPLVRSKQPGTLHLTAQRVAELLENDDVSA